MNPSATGNGHRPTVLVCEDEALLRHTLVRDLERAGYAVLEAENGEAARDFVSASQIDLLITDVRLPGISGWDLVAITRDRFGALPIIVMSAYGLEAEARDLRARYHCTFLDKPFPMATIRSEVEKALRFNSGAERNSTQDA